MYDYKLIEEKWNNLWKENRTYKVLRDRLRPPFYAICGCNCPSIDSYIRADALARYMRMIGYNVLFPVIKEDVNDIIYGVGMDYSKVVSKSFLYRTQKIILDLLMEKGIVHKQIVDDETIYVAQTDDFYDIVCLMNLPSQTLEAKEAFFALTSGYDVIFQVVNSDMVVKFFVEKLETLFISTFVVIPYDSDLALSLTNSEEIMDIKSYIESPIVDDLAFTGNFLFNPITEQNMPIFVGDVRAPLICAPSIDEQALKYAAKYDLDSLTMEYFDDFSLHLGKQAYETLSKMDVLFDVTIKNSHEIILARKKNDTYTFDPVFDNLRFVLAPISSNIDLDINVLDYQDEINKWLPIDLFCFQDGYELLGCLFVHYLLHHAGFIHNSMFSKKIVFHNPKSVHSDDNSDLCRILTFTNLDGETGINILKMIWHIYSLPLMKSFIEFDSIFKKLKSDVKEAYEKRDFNLALAYLTRFASAVNEKKGMSETQALGLLKMLYPLIPYMTSEIYQTIFNQISTIVYEDWPI